MYLYECYRIAFVKLKSVLYSDKHSQLVFYSIVPDLAALLVIEPPDEVMKNRFKSSSICVVLGWPCLQTQHNITDYSTLKCSIQCAIHVVAGADK